MSKHEKTSRMPYLAAIFKQIRAADLTVDPSLLTQRKFYPAWVKQRVDEFDAEKLGVLTVNGRADGKLYVIDGQHRLGLVRAVGWGDQLLPCMYYHGLTMPEEAALFRALNDRRAVKKIDDFRISVTAGVESSRDIVGIVQAIGLTISDQMRDGHIVAVSALEHVYSGGRVAGPREGRLALEKALKTILSAWGNQSSGFNGEIIKGVGLVYLRYGRKIEQEVMSAKLAPCTGGAPGLLGKARSMREIRGRQLHHCVAAIVVDIYNKGRRANKLDDWE